MFEILEKDGLARIGKFSTPHGTIETPAIMPVINPNLELIPISKLEEDFRAQMLITNSYILFKETDLKNEVMEKGVHELLGFSGPIMTDSGTFQEHVYGDIDVKPEEILAFQKKIGSDVSTILDEFTEPDDSREMTAEKVRTTVERAKQAEKNFADEKGFTAYPIQGSVFPDLREKCGREMSFLEEGVYPIGGVVPLMEDYRFDDLTQIIIASKKGLGPMGPVHLFGAGHPMLYPLAVLLGCDLFDSSSYAKYAKREDLMFPEGTKKLEDLDYLGCECPVCTSHTPQELEEKQEKERERLIAEHNLWICFKEIRKVKQAVKEGSLWELVEKRARGHPKLLEALKVLDEGYDFLEKFEPRSRRRAIRYTSRETDFRPALKRIKEWVIEEYETPDDGPTVHFDIEQGKKPYGRFLSSELKALEEYEVNLLVWTPIGPVPLEMDEVYPIAQSLFPSNVSSKLTLDEYCNEKGIEELIRWEGEETLESLSKFGGMNFDEMKINTIADYQFYGGAGEVLTDGELEFVKNNKGRIKNVILNDEHILSIRYYDGFFTLKKAGAEILKEDTKPPVMRTCVTDDSAEFNREGKNIFAKFVTEMSKDLRHGDETLVVDKEDDLVAVGRVFLTKEEVEALETGLAVRNRYGFES